jgi:hypothetical protein
MNGENIMPGRPCNFKGKIGFEKHLDDLYKPHEEDKNPGNDNTEEEFLSVKSPF